MADIVANRILDFHKGLNGRRVCFILDLGGPKQAVEIPIPDLVSLVPDLIALSRSEDGFGKAVVRLAGHSTAMIAYGKEMLLGLVTPEGWAISFQSVRSRVRGTSLKSRQRGNGPRDTQKHELAMPRDIRGGYWSATHRLGG